MDFSLTEDQKMLKAMVRDFAAKEIEPVASQIDEEDRFPAEVIGRVAAKGLMGIGLPKEYGGTGGGSTYAVIATEEIAYASAAVATIILANASLTGYPIYAYGNEAQRKKYLVPMAAGQKIGAFALTDPDSGSDVAALTATAKRKNNGYIINGEKKFISNGSVADIVVVFATIDKSLKHKGITAFIVERGSTGLLTGKEERKLGIRGAPTSELIFENCFVPETNRLGIEGEGFKIALNAIDSSRVTVAAQAVGIAQAALDKCLSYAKERRQFDQPIANFQAIQWTLADMATQIEAARLLTYQAAYFKDSGLPFIKESAMAKVFAAEVAMSVTTKAIQIYGGYGYMKDYPVERYFRDAKITEIYEGTSEMQRMTIARRLIQES